jgi:hypothetical protein
MLTSVIQIRLATRYLAGGVLIMLLAGCAGDDLVLPQDGTPAELRMVSGDKQSAPAGDPVQHPLIVEARDGGGRPVPGAAIVFEFVDPPSGAELAPANTETNEAGQASVEVKLGTPAGDQSVEARLGDPASELKVQFRLTALQPNRGGGEEGGGGDDEGDGGGGGGDGDGDGDNGGGGGGGGDGDDGGGGGGGGGDGGGGGGGDGDDGGDDDDDDDDDEESQDGNKGKGKGNGKGK